MTVLLHRGPATRHRVVIIGSGFGGLFAARELSRAPAEVTLISKTPAHVFQPLLYQVATGILSEGEVAPPTRSVLHRQKTPGSYSARSPALRSGIGASRQSLKAWLPRPRTTASSLRQVPRPTTSATPCLRVPPSA